MARAKVRVYGHSIYGEQDQLVSAFITTGGMHRSDGEPVRGTCFFVFPLDYSGLNPNFPRAHYQHLMVAHNFNWESRRGEYVHIPYGGRIEIEAD